MSRYQVGTSAYKLDEYDYYSKRGNDNTARRKVKKNKKNEAVCRFIIASAALVFAVASIMVYLNVMTMRASTKAQELKKELTLLTEQNNNKEMQINQKLDMKRIEEKAINELGMQRPENNQIVYVNVKQDSYTETEEPSKTAKGAMRFVKEALHSVVEYFSK